MTGQDVRLAGADDAGPAEATQAPAHSHMMSWLRDNPGHDGAAPHAGATVFNRSF
ncbi:hypothetical protein [Nonomuraea sp. NPDC050643]|uniref:hypothetical protein n=1 Tax=Nonomuraea sp. NPDC050643 TaxID=3155660 RepID=UPI003411A6ED